MNQLENFRDYWRRDRVFDFVNRPGFRTVNTKELDIEHGVVLYIEGVSVSFDGFKALNDLNLYINNGELRCIIGPNGAGKSTMMDVITGKTRPDEGQVFYGGTINLTQMSEHEIAQAGIGRKFQKPTVFPHHTVNENLQLAHGQHKQIWKTLFHQESSEETDRKDEILLLVNLIEQRNSCAGLLSHGQKQWLEIGMLLMQNPNVLLVDEPIAGMTHAETERTAELLTSLKGKHSVIVVEHDMEFIRSIAETVTVLHEGHVLAEGSMDQVQNNSKVIEVYLGE
ncbi:MAG: urea ABC transporter ATP-binding protein UrtD [Gammaproteobacteria bacterium]|nr:urea ABC transporter ATP-binding protein UrtD [Gammaproteobacteria bacterium]